MQLRSDRFLAPICFAYVAYRVSGVALVVLILALFAGSIPELMAFARPVSVPQHKAPSRPSVAPLLWSTQAQSTTGETEVEQWIKTNAIRLSTVQAGNGFADMEPLTKIVGSARIVALGEATHGTHEFFQLKHRMLEFLATRMGFTIFSIEANIPEAYRLNDYVLNGKGDPAQLLKGMYFWTWDTKEVLDMILWMREFNRSGKGRIEFTGFDMQTPTVAARVVSGFVNKNDHDYLSVIQKKSGSTGPTTSPLTGGDGSFPVEDVASKTRWREIVDHMMSSRHIYLAKGVSVMDVDWAIQNAEIVLQCLGVKSGETTRDQAMAENVKWILDHSSGAKIVLWAHNGHVGTQMAGYTMGDVLRTMYGDQMVVFGLAFNEGSFQAIGQGGEGLRNFTVAAAPPGSFDATLAASGIPMFALNLKHVSGDGPVSLWMNEPHKTRSIGAVYSEARDYFIDILPQATFDAILFVERITAALPNSPSSAKHSCQ